MKVILRLIGFVVFSAASLQVFTQAIGVGANVFTPDASAMLEVRATNKGILIPQVALTGVNDSTTIASPATSLLVYNTGTGGLSPAGYYYNAGTPAAPKWVKLQITREGWLLTGNEGTTNGNFLGTTDSVSLRFRTNNVERMVIDSMGNVGIGTGNPTVKLEVAGAIKTESYVIRRVNLTHATVDYPLSVGEEAYIEFANATSVPLHIQTQNGTYYELDLVCSNNIGTSGGVGSGIFLLPNNTTYTDNFQYVDMHKRYTAFSHAGFTYDAFRIGWAIEDVKTYLINYTSHKSIKGIDMLTGTSDMLVVHCYASTWKDTSTPWTSLGTITFPQSTSGFILVKRIK